MFGATYGFDRPGDDVAVVVDTTCPGILAVHLEVANAAVSVADKSVKRYRGTAEIAATEESHVADYLPLATTQSKSGTIGSAFT